MLRGAESTVLDRDVAERMAATLPSGRFVEIPRAVHTLHEDNPDAVLGRPSRLPRLLSAAPVRADGMPGPASHTYFSQRLRLHYVDWGNPGKPPPLLLSTAGAITAATGTGRRPRSATTGT